jgi:hypothetical protein
MAEEDMKTTIDLKSALLGLCLGVVAVLGLGAADGQFRPPGRYQCSTGGDALLIVDTASGQAWALRLNGLNITGAPGGFFDNKLDR